MSSTLTDLIPDAYEALDVVSRELTGYIPAVSRSSSVARAAIGQSVLVPVTGAESSAPNTPGVTSPDTGDTSVDNVEVAITKSKHVPIRWNGEQTKALQNAGTFSTIMGDRIYQAMRTLVNEIELDLHNEIYKNASRGYGATAGTAPFATTGDMSDFAGVLRILEENGAPTDDLQLVLGHAAIGNLRGKMSNLFKANEAGRDDLLRNGMTDRIMNFAIRHSGQIGLHTAGAGTGYDVNKGGGYAEGDTEIILHDGTVNSTGIKAGDLVTFAGDTNNKYNVITGTTATGATLEIGAPGLRQTLADTVEMTIVGSHVPNTAFSRSAVVLATRAPAMPEGGDMAADIRTVTDELTGLSFELALYKQFLQNVVHVRLAWGQRAVKQAHIAVLHG
jgi:hypothetical protein